MKQIVHSAMAGLNRLAARTRTPRWLMGPALGLLAAFAVVAVSTRDTHADRRDFTLINGSAWTTIVRVYVSPSDADDWGDDVLGYDVLYPGESTDIYFSRFSARCYYDIRVEGSRGEVGHMWGVNLCTTYTVTFH